jgi:peptidoglycan hydrolase CwlO-like protein
MGDVSLDMIWKRLEEVQTGQGTITQKIDALDQKIGALDHKVGSLAQTLLGVQRDLRRLSDTVETIAAAVDEHTHRLDRIEKRLGLVDA